MNVVLDTNILCKAAEHELDYLEVMIQIRRHQHSLTLDHANLLYNEYNRYVKDDPFFQKWYQEILREQRIYYCSHNIPGRAKRKLIEMGFHGEIDLVVVGLAINSDKYIIVEDSDFGKGHEQRAAENRHILEYFNINLGLLVHNANEAVTHLMHYA
jgi:AAA+ ATPase superfamily predicted ATPase